MWVGSEIQSFERERGNQINAPSPLADKVNEFLKKNEGWLTHSAVNRCLVIKSEIDQIFHDAQELDNPKEAQQLLKNAFSSKNRVDLFNPQWLTEDSLQKCSQARQSCLQKMQPVHTRKMEMNAQKAINEHSKEGTVEGYATLSEVRESETGLSIPTAFSAGFYELQGGRDTMEDAHFYKETDPGVFAGVFDGHGGAEVSKYASRQFEARFDKVLSNWEGDVRTAFETLITKIHQEVLDNRLQGGSTAVICYIDKRTGKIYTATLGDSEANLYRQMKGQAKSIPLSCVRDWWSKNDHQRLAQAHGLLPDQLENAFYFAKARAMRNRLSPEQIRTQHKDKFHKHLRSGIASGVNVARAIGDRRYNFRNGKPLVIQKPKITVNNIRVGDRLILACDGVKDYVPEKRIANLAGTTSNPQELAQTLVFDSYERFESTDNITALVIVAR